MAAGLQIFNPDGSLQFDSTDRLFRLLTTAVAFDNGSVSAPGLTEGTPVVQVVVTDATRRAPAVTVSGTTVTWDYGSTPPAERDTDAIVVVGVY